MIMVKAGAPVDAVISQLVPLLEKGDVIIDGGNSLLHRYAAPLQGTRRTRNSFCRLRCFRRRRRRAQRSVAHARRARANRGKSSRRSSRKIAAQVDGEPCCRYMGPDGAGHYVKMVHNGIEYGDMQLICEAYAILKDVARSRRRRAGRHFQRVESRGARQLSNRNHFADFPQT